MEGEGSNVLNSPCDDLVEIPNGSASATAGNHLFGMIQAQVEAIFNHPGRQAQVKGKSPYEDLVQNPSSASATAGTTYLLGTKAEWEGNARSFDYDEGPRAEWEGNARSFDYFEGTKAEWEGNVRSFDYDEGRKAHVKRKRPYEYLVENPSATAAASGSNVLNRHCDDLVENPNGSASATAGNNLFGMIKAQVGAIFNYLGRKAQVEGKRPCEDLVWNPTSASATAGTTRLLGAKAEWEGNARSFDYDEGRKAQVKRKRPCEDLVENPSSTAVASGTKAQVTGGPFFDDQYPPPYPCPEIKYQWEGDRFVPKIRYHPPSYRGKKYTAY